MSIKKSPPQRNIIIEVFAVGSDVFYHLDEGREVDTLLPGHSLGLQHHQVIDGLVEGVNLEILSAPDERAARLADGGAIGVGLL